MSNRVASLLLTAFLLAAAAPGANTAATNSTTSAPRQQPALKLEQTRTQQAWGEVLTLQGQYQAAGGSVSLRSTVSKTGAGINKPPPSASFGEIDPEQPGDGDPGTGVYYSYSEITRPDGVPLAQALYEYAASANRDQLALTVGGVTLRFDHDTQQATPLTAQELALLDAWAASEDARLLEEVSVAIIEQGHQQTDPELLLNYYAIAIFADPGESAASWGGVASGGGGAGKKSRRSAFSRIVDKLGASGRGEFTPSCAPAYSFSPGLVRAAPPRASCYGCCGVRCVCFRDRWGNVMSGGPCATHDQCINRNGYARGSYRCLGSFVGAYLYVWSGVQWGM